MTPLREGVTYLLGDEGSLNLYPPVRATLLKLVRAPNGHQLAVMSVDRPVKGTSRLYSHLVIGPRTFDAEVAAIPKWPFYVNVAGLSLTEELGHVLEISDLELIAISLLMPAP